MPELTFGVIRKGVQRRSEVSISMIALPTSPQPPPKQQVWESGNNKWIWNQALSIQDVVSLSYLQRPRTTLGHWNIRTSCNLTLSFCTLDTVRIHKEEDSNNAFIEENSSQLRNHGHTISNAFRVATCIVTFPSTVVKPITSNSWVWNAIRMVMLSSISRGRNFRKVQTHIYCPVNI